MGRAFYTAHQESKHSGGEEDSKVHMVSVGYFHMGKKDEKDKKKPVLVVLDD
jgi:hypothetical protein